MAVTSADGLRLWRQRSEQYLTSSQFFAQALRQLMGRPQTTQGLLGRWALLPLKSLFTGGVLSACAVSAVAVRRCAEGGQPLGR